MRNRSFQCAISRCRCCWSRLGQARCCSSAVDPCAEWRRQAATHEAGARGAGGARPPASTRFSSHQLFVSSRVNSEWRAARSRHPATPCARGRRCAITSPLPAAASMLAGRSLATSCAMDATGSTGDDCDFGPRRQRRPPAMVADARVLARPRLMPSPSDVSALGPHCLALQKHSVKFSTAPWSVAPARATAENDLVQDDDGTSDDNSSLPRYDCDARRFEVRDDLCQDRNFQQSAWRGGMSRSASSRLRTAAVCD